jgi:hypothetical protein
LNFPFPTTAAPGCGIKKHLIDSKESLMNFRNRFMFWSWFFLILNTVSSKYLWPLSNIYKKIPFFKASKPIYLQIFEIIFLDNICQVEYLIGRYQSCKWKYFCIDSV